MDIFNFKPRISNGFKVTKDMLLSESLDGSENKSVLFIDGEKFIMKDSSFNQRRKQFSLAPYCEYVGSNFIYLSGLLDCQQVFLGEYDERPVALCKDIFRDGFFRPFRDLHQSSAGTDLGNKEYTYEDVLYVLEHKQTLKDSEFPDFWDKFWLMFLFDAVLGNRDRHEGNWGFLKKGAFTYLAPIFDNGSSLFPDVNLSDWKHYEFVYDRVFKLPASQFRMWKPGITDRTMRTNFYEIIYQFHDQFNLQLQKMQELDYRRLIDLSILDVPSNFALWFRVIMECRFRSLILFEDFDSVWEDVRRRYSL